jgi:quercetin dioxygenase-like cupin family protein
MKHLDGFPEFLTRFSQAAVPLPGVNAWMVKGDKNQVVFAEFEEEVEVPEHSHLEQWEVVLQGSVILRMNGQEREFRAGESFFIPAHAPHSATVKAGYRAIIVFNEPDRYASA